MGIRQTSVEAYYTIKNNGLLSARRLQVYEYVYKNGPCSARDCHKFYAKAGTSASSLTGRFSELRDLGLFQEVGEKFDPETHMTVILWDVTDRLPTKIEKSKSRMDLAIEEERKACAQIAFETQDLVGYCIGQKILARGDLQNS